VDWTARMAYNYHFGSRNAFYDESFAQARANHPFNSKPVQAIGRSKRAAAQQASAVWAGLTPRKRQRQ
jgi:hypothetical protein